MRHEIGIDNLTWECDYPHSDSFWPESRARFTEAVQGIPDDEVHKIAELNARALFDFPAVTTQGSGV
jgi:predicted TIM-barrel fold metal-dependent hydrolase